jgi:transcriptional regulator with XRE-family HTH domain
MSIIKQLASQLSPEESLYHDWQYELARRISQIIEERNITQREFAKRARLTEAQVSALLHCGANPTLSMLARISALLDSELLTWSDSDADASKQQRWRSPAATHGFSHG